MTQEDNNKLRERFETWAGNNNYWPDPSPNGIYENTSIGFNAGYQAAHTESLALIREMREAAKYVSFQLESLLVEDGYTLDEIFTIIRGAYAANEQALTSADKYLGEK